MILWPYVSSLNYNQSDHPMTPGVLYGRISICINGRGRPHARLGATIQRLHLMEVRSIVWKFWWIQSLDTSNHPCKVFRRIHRTSSDPTTAYEAHSQGSLWKGPHRKPSSCRRTCLQHRCDEGELLNPLSVWESWLSGRLLDMIIWFPLHHKPGGVLLENGGTISTSPYKRSEEYLQCIMEPLTAILTSWIPIISIHRCGVVRSLEMKYITSWPELQCSHICHFPTRAKVPSFWEARAMFLSKQQMIEVSLSGCLLSCCVPQRINICCTCMWCMRLMMLADSCWNFWRMTISRLLDSAQKGLKVSYFYVPFLNFCCQRKSRFSWPLCEVPNLRVTSHLSRGVVPCCSYPTKYLQSLADCTWLFDDGLFGSCVVLINLCLVSIPPNQIPPNPGYLTTLVHLRSVCGTPLDFS